MGGEGRPPEPGAAIVVDADKAKAAKSGKSERKADRPDRPAEKPAAGGEARASSGGGGSGAAVGSSSRRERAAGEKPVERVSERPAEKEKERAGGAASGAGEAAAAEKRDKPKAVLDAAVPPAQRPSARHGGASRGGGAEGGLPEEVLTLIAQLKFESQEDKLRDVARFGVALIRDFPKLAAADCTKRVAEVQKALLKYEMQYIRSWEYQERRRRDEIKSLQEEAARCRQEAEAEGDKIVELRQTLEKERRRRKRYEGYEEAATEVNRKRTRTDYKGAIASVTDDIAQLKQRCQDYEALAKERTQRAQLLRSAVAELSADLQKEQELTGKVLEGTGGAAADTKAGSVPPSDLAEVIL